MPEPAADLPFPLLATVILAAQEGDFARAARAQERLRDLGWYVSRKPPEKPKPPRRKKTATTSTK
jgi:hypothetical protein